MRESLFDEAFLLLRTLFEWRGQLLHGFHLVWRMNGLLLYKLAVLKWKLSLVAILVRSHKPEIPCLFTRFSFRTCRLLHWPLFTVRVFWPGAGVLTILKCYLFLNLLALLSENCTGLEGRLVRSSLVLGAVRIFVLWNLITREETLLLSRRAELVMVVFTLVQVLAWWTTHVAAQAWSLDAYEFANTFCGVTESSEEASLRRILNFLLASLNRIWILGRFLAAALVPSQGQERLGRDSLCHTCLIPVSALFSQIYVFREASGSAHALDG